MLGPVVVEEAGAVVVGVGEVVVVELLLQPAANIRLPIAAVAAIACLPRKISLPSPSHVAGKSRRSWLDRSISWLDKLARR